MSTILSLLLIPVVFALSLAFSRKATKEIETMTDRPECGDCWHCWNVVYKTQAKPDECRCIARHKTVNKTDLAGECELFDSSV